MKPMDKESPEILKVLSLTPGGRHAWVESSVGRIRKSVDDIPASLLVEYVGAMGKT